MNPAKIAILSLMLLAAYLRLRILGQQSVAFDEGFSLAVSSKPLPILFQAILSDGVHPPFFYVIFKGALALYGRTEFGARFVTAVFSLAGIPLLYAFGGRIFASQGVFNRRLGLAAAALLAVSPIHIWLAQEARMYSLLSLLVTLNFWSFWHLLRRPKPRYWSGFVGSAALIYVVHYFGLLVPLIQFLFILLTYRHSRRIFIPWSISQVIAGLALLPWLVLTARREVQSFGIAFLVRPNLADIGQSIWNMTLGLAPHLWLIAIPGLLMVALSLLLAGRRLLQSRAVLLLALWGLVPILLVWAMSQQRSFYADRYLSFTIPAFLLLIVYGLNQLRPPVSTALIGLLWLLTLGNHLLSLGHPAFHKDNWRAVAQYIAAYERPDDIILLRSPHIQLPFSYYYRGLVTPKLTSFNAESYPIETLVEPNRRVWVVMPYTRRPTHYPMQPLTEASVWQLDPDARNLQTYVEANQRRILETQRFLGVQIWLIGPG